MDSHSFVVVIIMFTTICEKEILVVILFHFFGHQEIRATFTSLFQKEKTESNNSFIKRESNNEFDFDTNEKKRKKKDGRTIPTQKNYFYA